MTNTRKHPTVVERNGRPLRVLHPAYRTPRVSTRRPDREESPILKEARRYLVGGVNSPVRAFRHVDATPLILRQAKGVTVVSDRGERLTDYLLGWGPLILGHNHPVVTRALTRAMRQGVLFGLTHPAEVELARLIVDAVPSVEQVRFTVSGTEACLTAIKLARAHTGRTKILMFEGCYHGHSESVIAHHSAGIPGVLAESTIAIPYNDLSALETAMDRSGQGLAAVIIEPIAANMGVVLPQARFLKRLRELTAEQGTVLIFDEVVTGFRVGSGGAQGVFGIRPDLTTFGKIIGGGLPIGAVGGRRALMQRLAPVGDVYHGGTFAGHPLSMAAGIATLKELRAHPPYAALERLAQRLTDGLVRFARQSGVPIQVNRFGSMLTVFFSLAPVRDVAQAKTSRREQFARWANGLRQRGVLVPPSPFETLFLSTAHTERHIDQFVDASRAVFAKMTSRAT